MGLGQTAVWQRARDAKGNEWTQKRGAHRFPDPPPPGAPRTHDSQHCIHQPTAGPPRHTASNGGKALIVHRAHHGLENAELSLHKSESQVRSPRHTGRGPSSFLPHSVYSCPHLPTAPPTSCCAPARLLLGEAPAPRQHHQLREAPDPGLPRPSESEPGGKAATLAPALLTSVAKSPQAVADTQAPPRRPAFLLSAQARSVSVQDRLGAVGVCTRPSLAARPREHPALRVRPFLERPLQLPNPPLLPFVTGGPFRPISLS